MEQKYDEVVGSTNQRRAVQGQVDENMLQSLGIRPDLALHGETEIAEKPTLVTHFVESWRNERCAPEILPFERQLVNDMQQVIKSSQEIFNQKFEL